MGGEFDGGDYLIYMPLPSTWDTFEPTDIIQTRAPGYIILKHASTPPSQCLRLEELIHQLDFLVQFNDTTAGGVD